MSHVRQRIRERLVEDLKAASLPGVGDRVYGSVFHPFGKDELPAVCVYPEEEASQGGTMGDLDREVHMVIKVLNSAAENVEDQMDAIAAAIEKAVDPRAGGFTYVGRLFETRFERVTTEAAAVEHMAMELAYAFKYMTAYADAEMVKH